MPRKTPLADIDRAIAGRLIAVREKSLISQTDFADALHLTRAQLINYEKCISPVPWHVARTLLREFGVNPRWLATGRLPKELHKDATLPDVKPTWSSGRITFSKIYDTLWKSEVEHQTAIFVTFNFNPEHKIDDAWREIIALESPKEIRERISRLLATITKGFGSSKSGAPLSTELAAQINQLNRLTVKLQSLKPGE